MSTGRVYYYTIDNEVYTAAGGNRDIWEIAPAANKPVEIIRFRLVKLNKIKDAELEGLSIEIVHRNTTIGSGGTTYTAADVGRQHASSVDPSCTVVRNNTTIATGGGGLIRSCYAEAWGYPICEFVWEPDTRYQATSFDTVFCIRGHTTPAADVNFSGYLVLKEMG